MYFCRFKKNDDAKISIPISNVSYAHNGSGTQKEKYKT